MAELALTVEDCRTTRRVIKKMLEELEFRVVEAGSVAEARRWMSATKERPSLALIDWNLPDGDGLELIREWRATPKLRETQLLMLTSRCEREAVEAALAAGADEFLMKPCTVEALEDKLALLEFPGLPRPKPASPEARSLSPAAARVRRVLVVDDSAVVRRAVSLALEDHPNIEIIGTATNGRAAVQRVLADQPDVVVLDLEMPEVDGLEVLTRLREQSPHTAVIVFSSRTERGALATVKALLLGARACLAKPRNMRSFTDSLAWIREELGQRIEAIAARPPHLAPRVLAPVNPELRAGPVEPRPEMVVIAASTGGPTALHELLRELPEELDLPVVIVQHLPAEFMASFATQLDKQAPLPVRLARARRRPEPGTVWLAPGGVHLSLLRGEQGELEFAEDRRPPIGGCRPAADLLFAAAAELLGPRCLGLVLTGMGSDGCEGARRIVAAGGQVFAQDQASSAVWGMPGAVVRAGLASRIVPLEAMASELIDALGGPEGAWRGPIQ